MKYKVLENGKPTNYLYHNVDKSWNKEIFDTFEEALTYARQWLGPMGGSYDGKAGINLELNIPWDYGYGSTIEIVSFDE